MSFTPYIIKLKNNSKEIWHKKRRITHAINRAGVINAFITTVGESFASPNEAKNEVKCLDKSRSKVVDSCYNFSKSAVKQLQHSRRAINLFTTLGLKPSCCKQIYNTASRAVTVTYNLESWCDSHDTKVY